MYPITKCILYKMYPLKTLNICKTKFTASQNVLHHKMCSLENVSTPDLIYVKMYCIKKCIYYKIVQSQNLRLYGCLLLSHGCSCPMVPPVQWLLLSNGFSCSMVASVQWLLLSNGCSCPMVAPVQCLLLFNVCSCSMVAPDKWLLLSNGCSCPIIFFLRSFLTL